MVREAPGSRVRIETVAGDTDLEEVCDTEFRLLYVACTLAMDQGIVTGAVPYQSALMTSGYPEIFLVLFCFAVPA